MRVEQRLHRAAHELRELEITAPPLPSRPHRARRLPAVVTAVLLLAGAVGVTASGWGDPGGETSATAEHAEAAPAPAADTTVVRRSGTDVQLTPREELAMIANLGTDEDVDGAPAVDGSASESTGDDLRVPHGAS